MKEEDQKPAESETEMSKRNMMELQMVRDREREREEEEKKRKTSTEVKPEIKREKINIGKHKDLDKPQDETFQVSRELFEKPQMEQRGTKRAAEPPPSNSNSKSDADAKILLRRRKPVGPECNTKTLYGQYWNIAQGKKPLKEFDGRIEGGN